MLCIGACMVTHIVKKKKKKRPGKWPKAFCADKGATMPKKSHAASAGKSENPSCIVMSACSTATQHGTEKFCRTCRDRSSRLLHRQPRPQVFSTERKHFGRHCILVDSSRNAAPGLGKILQQSPSTLVQAPNPPTSRASSSLAGAAESKQATMETSPVTCH